MRILVTVKQVAALDDAFEVDDAIADRYVTTELNEWDEYGIETAVRIRAAGGDVAVVTVTSAPRAPKRPSDRRWPSDSTSRGRPSSTTSNSTERPASPRYIANWRAASRS